MWSAVTRKAAGGACGGGAADVPIEAADTDHPDASERFVWLECRLHSLVQEQLYRPASINGRGPGPCRYLHPARHQWSCFARVVLQLALSSRGF